MNKTLEQLELLIQRDMNSVSRPSHDDYKGWTKVSILDRIKGLDYREYVMFIGTCKKYCFENFISAWWYDTEAVLDRDSMKVYKSVTFYFKDENDALLFRLKYG